MATALIITPSNPKPYHHHRHTHSHPHPHQISSSQSPTRHVNPQPPFAALPTSSSTRVNYYLSTSPHASPWYEPSFSPPLAPPHPPPRPPLPPHVTLPVVLLQMSLTLPSIVVVVTFSCLPRSHQHYATPLGLARLLRTKSLSVLPPPPPPPAPLLTPRKVIISIFL